MSIGVREPDIATSLPRLAKMNRLGVLRQVVLNARVGGIDAKPNGE